MFSHIKSFPFLKKTKTFLQIFFFFFCSEDPSDLFILSKDFFSSLTFTNPSCGHVLFLISNFFFFCHVWNQVLVYLDKQVVEHFSLWWSTWETLFLLMKPFSSKFFLGKINSILFFPPSRFHTWKNMYDLNLDFQHLADAFVLCPEIFLFSWFFCTQV